ncbi:MAG: hypothetical protein COY38_04405 [Candidatus Aenigmarchaeota archaeon CG_4_10_14_0_8_um_filter_37_24]|nr:hypothetical protein [Candidatus Aenigmarchaeota archaeon]OIN85341.1 MAG: hypothetical protein AUJ50_05200 [Candidatus Aenigmarchaeota archaeon CG1_02_38_14]PIV69143.1 MAG: hypothetical protein COS07_01735 [Candidatus Aenigmarchaeota archaeon CG01_land_8_20_14_3_00_37_9]PIW40888.1 MAG: hypothetical protein COW21_04800 [Candidatus Aenigmarchaeota archaeon CG15_BIG_FIL_POST_REV_8_21_14_020_37_27]PIX51161.1 MAG: hypothetical protein COZ52_00280 [Candidatus Aenigmarchaeota archaeon CG_4_8_14_3_u
MGSLHPRYARAISSESRDAPQGIWPFGSLVPSIGILQEYYAKLWGVDSEEVRIEVFVHGYVASKTTNLS